MRGQRTSKTPTLRSEARISSDSKLKQLDNGGEDNRKLPATKFTRRRRRLFLPAMARLVLVAVVLSLLLGVEGGKRGGKGKPGKVAGALPISSKPKSVAGSPARAPDTHEEAFLGSEDASKPGTSPGGRPRVARTRVHNTDKTKAANRAAVAAYRLRSTISQVSLCTSGPP